MGLYQYFRLHGATADASSLPPSLQGKDAAVPDGHPAAAKPPKHQHAAKYRADIDGLRAVAVLSVVVFHAFPDVLKGGFTGVDIFFVISGFLISTILFEGLETGTFRFTDFYVRRVRRIFPALLTVLAACFAFGWFALLAEEYKQLGKHIAAGAGFIANLVLWSEVSYFDNAAETKPLLHLWSLGIEEQFYLLWPLVLWMTWKARRNLFLLTLLVGGISFALNLRGVGRDATATFYSPQTRFWELAAGSALGWLMLHAPRAAQGAGRQAMSAAGMALLAASLLLVDKHRPFPGAWAVLPVCGAALVIAAGADAWLNRQVLSRPVMTWFGRISFPLYLWHWPLLSFARIVESGEPSLAIRCGAVALAVALAWLTLRLVEQPLRFGPRGNAKAGVLALLMTAIALIGFATYRHDGFPARSAAQVAAINDFTWPYAYRKSCKALTREDFFDDWCNMGTAAGSRPAVVMFGDSFANALSTVLDAYAPPRNLAFSQYGRGQCPALLGFGPDYCRKFAETVYADLASRPDVHTIVIAANWPAYYHGKDFYWVGHKESAEAFRIAFETTLQRYQALGRKLVVFLAPPVGAEPKACMVRPVRLSDRNACKLPLETARAIDGDYRSYMLPYLQRQGIPVFDPFAYLCDAHECKLMDGPKILNVDAIHLSVHGGAYLAATARDRLDTLLATP